MIKPSIETKSSWIVASVSLVILSFSFGAPWIAVVGLKSIAADTGGSRSVPALASSLAWFGLGLGGIAMGQIADRFGVRWTVIFGSVMICTGLAISTLGEPWQLVVGHGIFMGLLGNAGFNAPLYVYVSRWFDRRRGSALALISSGSYIAGTIWPNIFERTIAFVGWRQTMLVFGLFEVAMIIPLALIFLRLPPAVPAADPGAKHAPRGASVFGWRADTVFVLLSLASFLCCVPMAMPQGHLVAFCSDLGIVPAHGAAMLSLLLGTAFVSRQFWGLISDRIGGLLTVLAGSACQAAAMTALLFTQDEIGLFTVSAAFGFGFSGIIPAYVLALRQYYPVGEAAWRVPTLLFCGGAGMAAGGWMAGALYDRFGFYAPAFVAGLAANILHLAVIGTLVARRHARA